MIVVTTFEGDYEIQRALTAGAFGYVLKSAPLDELVGVIRKVYAGRKHLPAVVAENLAVYVGGESLTEREIEVLGELPKATATAILVSIWESRRTPSRCTSNASWTSLGPRIGPRPLRSEFAAASSPCDRGCNPIVVLRSSRSVGRLVVVRRLHSVHSRGGGSMALQRTFSGFPTGQPGLALLLLRLVVGRCREFAGLAGYRCQPWRREH